MRYQDLENQPGEIVLAPLVVAYCEELAAYVLSPAGTEWAKGDFTPDMDSLALSLQTAIKQWVLLNR
jgi:hypothetical protein